MSETSEKNMQINLSGYNFEVERNFFLKDVRENKYICILLKKARCFEHNLSYSAKIKRHQSDFFYFSTHLKVSFFGQTSPSPQLWK